MTDRFARSFDVDAVNGPEWPRIARDHFDMVARALEDVHERVDETEGGAGDSGPYPRTRGCIEAVGVGFDISPADAHPHNSTFDDYLAAAATQINLPTLAAVDAYLSANGWARETHVLVYHFHRMSAFTMRIKAATGTDIMVGTTTVSVDGGHVDLTAENSFLKLALIDDRWRAQAVTGTWHIDAP